ncbi:MAG TPA: endonuclease/exonuclease/phosphatase family protein [bacterium]|nr:endonuclease/exonuclease/phosphatase family protein [bacterium]
MNKIMSALKTGFVIALASALFAFAAQTPRAMAEDSIGSASPEPSRREITLKVMTINLRHHADLWEERFPLIADEIVRLDPDIIGLQEVSIGMDQTAVLLSLIKQKSGGEQGKTYNKYERLKTGFEAVSGEGISIYSRFPIVEKNFTDLKNGRVVVFTRINVADGLDVDMYNTHLHHMGGDETRLPQAKKIVAFEKRNSAGNIVFLTGDMNAKPESETIAAFTGAGFEDTYVLAHGETAEDTGKTSSIRLEKGRDAADQNPKSRIDYVFVKQPDSGPAVKTIDSVVCFRNHNEEGLYPSDHLGVMTTFLISY